MLRTSNKRHTKDNGQKVPKSGEVGAICSFSLYTHTVKPNETPTSLSNSYMENIFTNYQL